MVVEYFDQIDLQFNVLLFHLIHVEELAKDDLETFRLENPSKLLHQIFEHFEEWKVLIQGLSFEHLLQSVKLTFAELANSDLKQQIKLIADLSEFLFGLARCESIHCVLLGQLNQEYELLTDQFVVVISRYGVDHRHGGFIELVAEL